jgi:hypothetical protein
MAIEYQVISTIILIFDSLHQELKDVLSVVADDADEVVEEVQGFWQLDYVCVAVVDGEAEF